VTPMSPASSAVANVRFGIALVGFVLALMHLAAPVLSPTRLPLFLAAQAAPGFSWLPRKGRQFGPAMARYAPNG
jgi:hypothetical protein